MRKLIQLCTLLAVSSPAFAALTTIADVLHRADGSTCSGSLFVTWSTFMSVSNQLIFAGSIQSQVINGVVNVSLEPGTYRVGYNVGPVACTPTNETWVVPVSSVPLTIASVRNLNPPPPGTSIALTFLASGGAVSGQCLLFSGTAWGPGACGPWTVSGSDIYNSNVGNVGIGGAPGNYKVDVSKSGSTGTARFFDQTATTGHTNVDVFAGALQAGSGVYQITRWFDGNYNPATTDPAISVHGDGTLRFYDAHGDAFAHMYLKGWPGTAGPGAYFASDAGLRWNNNANVDGSTPDIGINRNAAGVLEINNGTLGVFANGKWSGQTLTSLSGSGTRCVHTDNTGLLGLAAADCGSGGLADPGGNGVIVRTSLNTTTNRSIAATSPITVTNADGTAGNPTLACATCLTGNQSITLSGDASGSGTTAITVTNNKLNGIAYSATAAAHSVEVITTANTTATAKTLPDCQDSGGNHLNYTQSSDAFSCGTSGGGGGGGVTSVTIAGTANHITVSGTCTITTTGTCTADLASRVTTRSFGATFTANGSALSSGATVYFTIPFACTISAWNITISPADTATIDIWKIATGTAIPTVANTIVASAAPAISTGTAIHSTTLTGWTTTVAANDIFGINLKTVGGTATQAGLVVECDQ